MLIATWRNSGQIPAVLWPGGTAALHDSPLCISCLPSDYRDFSSIVNNPPNLEKNRKMSSSLTHLQTAPFMSKAIFYRQTLRKGKVYTAAHGPWSCSSRYQAGFLLHPKSTVLHKLLPAGLRSQTCRVSSFRSVHGSVKCISAIFSAKMFRQVLMVPPGAGKETVIKGVKLEASGC